MQVICNKMSFSDLFLDRLRAEGFRITVFRRALIDTLVRTRKPFTAQEIHDVLISKGINPNVTTIYREIDFLVDKSFLRPLHLDSSRRYYELVTDHHHHIVCRSCGKIEEIRVDALEELIPNVERQIKRSKSFVLVDHSLEFFGVCSDCFE